MVVVPSGYEVGELANKHFFASLCVRHNLVSARFVREATPLTDPYTYLFQSSAKSSSAPKMCSMKGYLKKRLSYMGCHMIVTGAEGSWEVNLGETQMIQTLGSLVK
eukprot:sb/3477772/